MKNKILLVLLLILAVGFSSSITVTLPTSACSSGSDFLSTLTSIPQCTAEAIFTTLTNGLIYSAQSFYEYSVGLLTATPNLSWFCDPYSAIMSIVESFYIIMLMGLGIYYIINSSDVEGRIKAKIWLKNIFLMMITLAFSYNIFQLILDANQYVSTSMYASVSSSLFTINAHLSNLIFAFIFSLSLSSGGFLTFSTLIGRYVLIPLLFFLFPVGIFLYFTPPTKEWGSFIFRITFLIIFMTTIDAILLAGMSSLFASPDPTLADTFVRSFGLMAGFGLIGLVNAGIFLIGMISIVSKGISALESAVSTIWRLAALISML